MTLYQPQKIYLERKAQNFPTTERILAHCPHTPVEIIDEVKPWIRKLREMRDPIGEGKRVLFLAYDKGQSFKPFPESESYFSCDYHTLHVAEGCDLECSYCILQAYLTNPFLTIFVNIEEMLAKLQKGLEAHSTHFFRIGTGQLADSLSLDHLTGFSRILIPFFAKQKNAVLELKTKSTNIDHLLDLTPRGKTIVSWSMNSEKIQREEEHKCASIEARIKAAHRICGAQDYRIGFHFDPIMDYEGWENDYAEVIRKIFTNLSKDRIAWISLGCLRMLPDLKPIMQERFPKSPLAGAEWIRDMDGKKRYFKPRRIEIYKTMVAHIRRWAPEVTLYLSMESAEVWKQIFGYEATRESVCALLDQAGTPKGGSDREIKGTPKGGSDREIKGTPKGGSNREIRGMRPVLAS